MNPTRVPDAEYSLLGAFFVDQREAGLACVGLTPEHFTEPYLPELFLALTSIDARGEAVDPVSVASLVPGSVQVVGALLDATPSAAPCRSWASMIDKAFRTRSLLDLLDKTRDHALATGSKDGGRMIAERLTDVLSTLYSPAISTTSRDEVIDDLLALTEEDSSGHVDVPIAALNAQIGPLVPSLGELVGLTAYSGGGKSTLAANLALGWVLQDQPVIVFPTEMGKRFVARMAAAYSITSQMRAEKNVWSDEPSMLAGYRAALMDLKKRPLEVVLAPNISPRDIVTRARILARRYDKPPVVIVDHLHRLDYNGQDPNKMVGSAAKRFKDFAVRDECIVLALLQPKKPEEGPDMSHRPVSMYQVRGDSGAANELDVHMSVYRPYIFQDLTEADGSPKEAKNHEQAGVIRVSTHMAILPDKRRIGGEGKRIWCPFDSRSGLIEEVLGA